MNFEDSASGYITNETIYGTHEDSHAVMSEKVQTLAGSIYKEFERMIARYDEDVVKTLMPLVINVLECLDSAYQTNQEHEVELELLKEDNEQLITQYDREKSARKHAEQKHLEAEDHYEGEKKELTGRQESLESIVRMLELKHKNSVDHANRLEERENELKKEYTKLHERYTELFKTHMDYMERTKLLISSDRSEVCGRLGINPLPRSSGHISIGFASLEGSVHVVDQSESMPGSPVSLSESPPSPTIGSELAAVQTMERAHQTDPVRQATQATSPVTPTTASRSHTKNEKRSGNTLYQEFAFNDMETSIVEGEEASDITGSMVHPAEYASSVNDNYFGMGKEVENLIKENNELLVTKNALNVVKDDLIDKVDELTGQQEILREEVGNLKAARAKLQERVTQLEDQLRQLKDVVSNNAGGENEDEADVPMAQRKRFTRVEMARVLMERNQYKERFMELQDAVRITEMMRATRVDSTIDKNKQSIWKLFSNLFSSSERSQRPLSTPHLGAVAVPQPAMRHSRTQADFLETQLSDHHHLRRHERTEQFRQVRAHVRKEDGRTQAYGWSLPGKGGQKESAAAASLSSGGVPVPVPVFCRPLVEAEPRMSLQCAAAANTRGGRAADGSCVVGESVFYYGPDDEPLPNTLSLAEEMTSARHCSPDVEDLNRHLESTRRAEHMQRKLSSLVWVCSSTQTKGVVMVIDANNPAEVLSAFPVADKLILCVASVPGATASDYRDVGRNVPNLPVDSPDTGEKSDTSPIGSVKLVQSSMPTPPTSPAKQSESKNVEDASIGSPPLSSTPKHSEKLASPEPGVDAFAEEQSDGDKAATNLLTSVQATMWLGTKSGNLYVHSAIASYGRCLDSVKLNQAILSIVWCAGRVVVALADGTVAIFARQADGKWNLRQYWLLTLGDPKCSVRCLSAVGCTVWCGYRNKVHVVDPVSLELLHTLEAHPRHESQVRQMVCDGDGVWVTIKMDSTLRLYHAHTYKHLGDVDIEPYVSKMLGTGKLGFSLVRITALLISSGRLWIGTSNGVVISVPLSDGCSKDQLSGKNTQGVASLAGNESVSESSIPWCSMAQAQLSFHGHRDAVKFFVAVPGHSSPAGSPTSPPTSPHLAPALPPMLVMSGGEGYIDFRIADSEMEDSVIVAEDGSSGASSLAERVSKSHLIVWQVARA